MATCTTMIPDQRRLTPVLGSPVLDCRRRLSRLPSVIFNPGKAPATRAPSAVSPRAYATVVKERLGPNQNGSWPSSDSNVRNAHRMEMPVASRPTKAPTRPSTSVSAKSWATTRPRSAPSATRTRISRSRVAARTKTSRATLAAIRIRNRMKRPLLDMSPTDTEFEMSITSLGKGSTCARNCWCVSGFPSTARWVTVVSSTCASSRFACGARRPKVRTGGPSRGR